MWVNLLIDGQENRDVILAQAFLSLTRSIKDYKYIRRRYLTVNLSGCFCFILIRFVNNLNISEPNELRSYFHLCQVNGFTYIL